MTTLMAYGNVTASGSFLQLYQETSVVPDQLIWDDILGHFRDNFNLFTKNITIDEAMIQYKGFKSFVKKFFMLCKPIRASFKLNAICNAASYYLANFKVHPQHGSKIYTISKDLIWPVYNKYHHAFAKKLLQCRTYQIGALTMFRKGLPTHLCTNISPM